MTGTDSIGDLLPPGWGCIHEVQRPARPARLADPSDLDLHPLARRFLDTVVPNGIYAHQHRALEFATAAQHVCLTTGTASGKSLAFQTLALHHLGRDPEARILAIYPQKSLGFEQAGRWRDALAAAGMPDVVARIDGSVLPVSSRSGLLKNARVLVVTPDIIHAWLLSNLSDKAVRSAIRSLALVIVDEVHTYSGVFGSNSAFLFRRLRHAADLLGARPQFFCASATIRDPDRHVAALCGVECQLVGDDLDSSPRQGLSIALVEPPENEDFLAQLTALLRQVLEKSAHRFVAFVDSRKQTEHIATILNRRDSKSGGDKDDSDQDGGGEGRDDDGPDDDDDIDDLAGLDDDRGVLPYRAGYEESDRARIQRRLTSGELRGVISTSALELGIDIPHLDLAILVGVPRSATSLTQRVGRVGRQRPGHALVVNSRDAFDSALFKDPERVLDRPLAESTLYLENVRIQHIHALCLARSGGEHDTLCGNADAEFKSSVTWPDGFLSRCIAERTGQVEPELQSLSLEAGDSPHHTFPLRDVERQFDIEWKSGPTVMKMGSLGYTQLMREAYPGAVYLHMARPYRVYSVSLTSRKVWVRRERFYPTRPAVLPTLVFPNLSGGNVHRSECRGDLTLIECQLQVREAIAGFEERRGSAKFATQYPVDGKVHPSHATWKAKRFARNYFTSGVVIAHPAMSAAGVQLSKLAPLVIDAILMVIPFERQDIGAACDKFRGETSALEKDQRFLAIYDQTYGSLRLSSRVLERGLLPKVLQALVELVEEDEELRESAPTVAAVKAIALDADVDPSALAADPLVFPGPPTDALTVILPGSKALNTMAANSEFRVESVFFSPKLQGPAYRAVSLGGNGSGQVETWPISAFVGIPGVTRFGSYDPDTGEVSGAAGEPPTAEEDEETYD